MNGTVLKHPLVRMYLQELSAACAPLPKAQARELHEQIAAHLDDALVPDAGDEAVRTELDRLGSPSDLAAEAMLSRPTRPRGMLRNYLSRIGWKAWTASALTAVILAGAGTYLDLMATAAPIEFNGSSMWWDNPNPEVQAQGETGMVELTPIRWLKDQGIVISVDNPSDWSQTILGLDGGWYALPLVGNDARIAGGVGPDVTNGPPAARYSLPWTIPPHGQAWLRVLWRSTACLGPRDRAGVNQLQLRVRVGIFTRTETITIGTTYALSGPTDPACRKLQHVPPAETPVPDSLTHPAG
jgi:hypothetical protein